MSNIDFENGFIIGASTRMGGVENRVQSDWNQNDSFKKDYIKNRTHWKEDVEVDYLTIPYAIPDESTGLAKLGRKIGLVIGTEYVIDVYSIDGAVYSGLTYSAIEAPKEEVGISGAVTFDFRGVDTVRLGTFIDGIDIDTDGNGYLGDNCLYTFAEGIEKIVIHGINSVETVCHKIPNEYIEIDEIYSPTSTLPQSGVAVAEALQTVKQGLKELPSSNINEWEDNVVYQCTDQKTVSYTFTDGSAQEITIGDAFMPFVLKSDTSIFIFGLSVFALAYGIDESTKTIHTEEISFAETLDENSTDLQVPTAKLVYEKIKEFAKTTDEKIKEIDEKIKEMPGGAGVLPLSSIDFLDWESERIYEGVPGTDFVLSFGDGTQLTVENKFKHVFGFYCMMYDVTWDCHFIASNGISAVWRCDINNKTVDYSEKIPTTTIDDNSTNNEYPTTLAVKTYVDNNIDTNISSHNVNIEAHNDIRLELQSINDKLTAFFDTDNTTLDELSEIVTYITNNKTLIDNITTSKVNVSDIIDNLTTNVSNKPLSAAQGVVLKGLIDSLSNNKLNSSELTNAINTALEQAKASGEFDGADGKDGTNGESGIGIINIIITEV